MQGPLAQSCWAPFPLAQGTSAEKKIRKYVAFICPKKSFFPPRVCKAWLLPIWATPTWLFGERRISDFKILITFKIDRFLCLFCLSYRRLCIFHGFFRGGKCIYGLVGLNALLSLLRLERGNEWFGASRNDLTFCPAGVCILHIIHAVSPNFILVALRPRRKKRLLSPTPYTEKV